jgi:hypothetical protein
MLKNLKSLFVVTEESSQNPNQEQNSQTTPNASSNKSEQTEPASSPQVDNTILDKLLNALEENNQSGFDYLEYRRSLISLAALPMDESIKFQSAFATASTMGVTLEKLLSSIDFYKKVLKNEEDNFQKASKEKYSMNVEGKLKEKGDIHNYIQVKSQTIQKLTEEIRRHQAELEELNKHIENAELKINQTKSHFDAAMKVLITQMDNDAQKLKQFIK